MIEKEASKNQLVTVRIAKSEEELLTAPDFKVHISPITMDIPIEIEYEEDQHTPKTFVEGERSIYGSFTPLTNDFFDWMVKIQRERAPISETYCMGVFPKGVKEGEDAFVIKNVRFEGLNKDLLSDKVDYEDLSWFGKEIKRKTGKGYRR